MTDREKESVDLEQLKVKLMQQLQYWSQVRDQLIAQGNAAVGRIKQLEDVLAMLETPSETLADLPAETA